VGLALRHVLATGADAQTTAGVSGH
jgi:hypothetical protein